MNWKEQFSVVGGFIILIQFVYWVFRSLALQEKVGYETSFFLSIIFSSLIIMAISLIQIQKEIIKIKGFLYKINKNDLNERGIMKEGSELGKKGSIDARIILAILII